MVCPKCGKELADNVIFCNKCGFKVVSRGPADGPTDTLNRTNNTGNGQQGSPSGVLQGGPKGNPSGVLQGGPKGNPSGVLQGGPKGNPSGVLQGGPKGSPSGILQNRPQGNPSGVLQGGTPYGTMGGASEQKKSLMVPIIISSFVLLALIISIIVVVVKKNGEKAEAKQTNTTEATAEATEASTEKAKEKSDTSDIEKVVTDVKLYEIKDGMFFFECSLFGKSYDEVKTYVESLGYKYAWDEETKWEYGSEDNITANRIDLNKKHILGLYFQDHVLVAATFEHVGVGSISKDIINTAKLAFGKCTLLSHEDKNKPFEIFCRYGKKNPNIGDSEAGSYAAFLNPYNDVNHLDQQYLSDRFEGSYINPNFTNVRTK